MLHSATSAALVETARTIAIHVAAPNADSVDRDSRFPHETISALREAGLLSLPIPSDCGGPGGSFAQITEVLRALAAGDAAVGLILTMHFSQLMVIARHGTTDALHQFLTEAHEQQWLVANSNSEMSVAGSDRRSLCSLVEDGPGWLRLSKDTPVISYGEYADAYLITTRRAGSDERNQSLALAKRSDVTLTPLGEWDAMGLRGSCSRPFHVEARVAADMVLTEFRQIVDATGLPITNLMFAATWVGMGEACVGRSFVRKRHAGAAEQSVVARVNLAELVLALDQLRGLHAAALSQWSRLDGTDDVASLAYIMQLQSLKVAGSRLNVQIALGAMTICGIAGFRNDGPFSLGRAVRDAIGTGVMVSNDAVLTQNGQLALMRKSL